MSKPLLLFVAASIVTVFSSSNTWCAEKVENTRIERNRYTIEYAANWQEHDEEKGTIVFAYPISNTKLSAMVNIQSLYTKAGGGKYKSVKDLMDDFLIQVPMHEQDAQLFNRQPYVLTEPNGQQLSGEQIFVTFKQNKQTYKQWQIMLMTSDGVLFQAFAYRAPIQYYDAYLPAAQRMLASWVIE